MSLIAQILVIISAVWLIGVSVFMFALPEIALRYLGKFASTNLINYTEITLRMIAGIAFVLFAPDSKFPLILESFGWILVVTSAILYLVPRKWHSAYAVYWSEKLTPLMLRIVSPISLAAGIFLIYATS